MKKIIKFKKDEKVFNQERTKEIIKYINKELLMKGTNEIDSRFKKDIKLIIQIE